MLCVFVCHLCLYSVPLCIKAMALWLMGLKPDRCDFCMMCMKATAIINMVNFVIPACCDILFTVSVFVCFGLHLYTGFFVRDISGVGWHSVMKFGRMVDQVGELWPRGYSDPGQKVNFKILTRNISKTVTDTRLDPLEALECRTHGLSVGTVRFDLVYSWGIKNQGHIFDVKCVKNGNSYDVGHSGDYIDCPLALLWMTLKGYRLRSQSFHSKYLENVTDTRLDHRKHFM